MTPTPCLLNTFFFQRTLFISGHTVNATKKGLELNSQKVSVLQAKWEARRRKQSSRARDLESVWPVAEHECGWELPGFPSGSSGLAVWPWAGTLTSLPLDFLSCKTRLVIIPPPTEDRCGGRDRAVPSRSAWCT